MHENLTYKIKDPIQRIQRTYNLIVKIFILFIKMEENYDKYIINKELGRGSYGEIYDVIRKSDSKRIALKTIMVYNPRDVENVKGELDALQKLSQPFCNTNVICYYNNYYDSNNRKYYIETELIEGDTFSKTIKDLWIDVDKGTKSPNDVYNYILKAIRGITEGLKYIHDKGVIHNDIKGDNIMIEKTNSLPKIIDFGFGCLVYEKKSCINSGRSLFYSPPEFTRDNISFTSSDMWALGVTLYEAATNGKFIYDDVTKWTDLRVKLQNINPKKLNTSNIVLNNIVNGLLIRNKYERLTTDQILMMLDNKANNKFIDNFINNNNINKNNFTREQMISIALTLDFSELILYCNKFNNFNLSVCKSNIFWVKKIKRDFNLEYKFLSGAKNYYEALISL